LIAFGQIDPTHLSDDVFAALLQYSPFVPADLLENVRSRLCAVLPGRLISTASAKLPKRKNVNLGFLMHCANIGTER
jgi:hypothetical protein